MTIQEYIRIAANGYPKEEFLYYAPYFMNMDCKWCMFRGYACRHPKEEGVCIEYKVEKKDLEFIKPNERYEKKV